MTSSNTVKKIMSATPNEFYRSLRTLAPKVAVADGQTDFVVARQEGEAKISFTVLPPRRVTGLLSLPQMEVVIDLDGVEDHQRVSFMDAFDLAFRRGGG